MDTLRPSTWDDYLGQDRIKNELEIRIQSALKDERALGHVLLAATPGAGKTSLAEIIAERLDEAFMKVTMPITQTALNRLVQDFEGVVLFDEIHRCSTKEQEMLLDLLEFGYVSDRNGGKIRTEWLTVIGATTEKHKLIGPLLDRFEIAPEYDEYSDLEMAAIARSMAAKADLDISEDAAMVFGMAAAGTPRRVRQFVLAYRDLLGANGEDPTAAEVLEFCQAEYDGLSSMHIRYLETLHLLGGAKGIDVIVSLLRQPRPLVIEWERLLIEKGFIGFGEKGREITPAGRERIGTKAVRSSRRPKVDA